MLEISEGVQTSGRYLDSYVDLDNGQSRLKISDWETLKK